MTELISSNKTRKSRVRIEVNDGILSFMDSSSLLLDEKRNFLSHFEEEILSKLRIFRRIKFTFMKFMKFNFGIFNFIATR